MAKKGILNSGYLHLHSLCGWWNGEKSKIHWPANISKAKKQISEVLSKKDSGKEVIQISSKKIYEKEVKDIWEDIIEKLERERKSLGKRKRSFQNTQFSEKI